MGKVIVIQFTLLYVLLPSQLVRTLLSGSRVELGITSNGNGFI